jgi:ABC-type transport system substrate-binding protein
MAPSARAKARGCRDRGASAGRAFAGGFRAARKPSRLRSPMEPRSPFAVAVLVALAALCCGGCAGRSPAHGTSCVWIAGRLEPAFDPGGPPDALRWAVERLLARGLVEEDSSGALVPGAADRWEWSADSLALTFHLRSGLVFADGTPCGSADFRRALCAGLGRGDHGSRAWLLSAVSGVERVRAGRPLPPLGVETPDPRTLVLRLARRDPLLPAKLALPGLSAPWSAAASGGWRAAAGLGPYRVLGEEPGRALTLVRCAGAAGPDTIVVRFQPVATRVLTFLRTNAADLVWPLPATLDAGAAPPGYRLRVRAAAPARALLLVMRADLPPTSRLATRSALAHSVNRDRVLELLGARAERLESWLPGAGPYDFPALDERQAREWMGRGKLGQAFHVVMGYDADGAGAAVARALQEEWSRLGIYAELRPLRGSRLSSELLGGLSQLALVEEQPWTDDPAGTLASLVMPLRGPAVGAFRTGWRTREFDGLLGPGRGSVLPGPDAAQARLREDLVALPLARLPWVWLARENGSALAFHPRFGPGCSGIGWPAPPGPVEAGARGAPPDPNGR